MLYDFSSQQIVSHVCDQVGLKGMAARAYKVDRKMLDYYMKIAKIKALHNNNSQIVSFIEYWW